MLKAERLRAILNEVEVHNRVLLTDLASAMDVSIDTIRRDVKELDAAQKLRKVHGGAVSLGFAPVTGENLKVYALKEKRDIANKGMGLISDDMVIFIDGGTTCLEFARSLPAEMKLTCFTHSLPVALVLMSKPMVRTIFIGGTIAPESQVAIGSDTLRNFEGIQFDMGFIGTAYVDVEHGLTEFDWEIVQVKKAIISASRKTALLCISEKLNSRHRYTAASLSDIDKLITEKDPGEDILQPFHDQKIEII